MTQKLTPAPNWITRLPIAHRGFHDKTKGCIENSLSAFKEAIAHGFAIECDLQVSATGEPVVFHDPVLGRLTGLEGNVRDKTPAELAEISLLGSTDTIATLKQHLDLVDGAVPLVLELKGVEGEDDGFVEGVAASLRGYRGDACVMSFDHWICVQFAELLPDIPRGLTAEGGDDDYDKHLQAMHRYDLGFVSYGVRHLPNRFVGDMKEHGLPIITWTVRTQADQDLTRKYADQMTFEGFTPHVDQTTDHQ